MPTRRLAWMVLAPLLGLLVVLAIAVGALAVTGERSQRLAGSFSGDVLTAQRASHLHASRSASFRAHLLSGDPAPGDSDHDLSREVSKELAELRGRVSSPATTQRITRIEALDHDLLVARAELLRQKRQGAALQELAEQWNAEVRPKSDALELELEELSRERQAAFVAAAEQQAFTNAVLTGLVVVGGIATASVVGLVLWLVVRQARQAAAEERRQGEEHESSERSRDITDRHELVRRLEASLRMRDELIGIASHDLRGPLTAMRLEVQKTLRLARSGKADLSVEASLARLRWLDGKIARTAELLGYLLALSRADETGAVSVTPSDVDLSGVVRGVCDRFRARFQSASTDLVVEVDGPLVGHWDVARLEEIVGNLLTNALQYGRGKPVLVRAEGSGPEAARLIVRDRGPGIPVEAVPRLVRRHERASRDPRTDGLGLWIVCRAAESLGGRVSVRNNEDEGSTLTVELPFEGPRPHPAATEEDSPAGLFH